MTGQSIISDTHSEFSYKPPQSSSISVTQVDKALSKLESSKNSQIEKL